jgi:hypothetical protein
MRVLRTIGLAATMALAASATMVPRLSLEEMVDRSELIVRGRSVRTWSAWDAKGQFIWTHNEIEVAETWKGGPGARVIVSEIGGTVGDDAMQVEGVPQYQAGEEVVLFLYRTPIGYWRARGMGQGKFRVAAGGKVRTQTGGAALIAPTGAVHRGTDLGQLDGASLDQLRSLVRALIPGGRR